MCTTFNFKLTGVHFRWKESVEKYLTFYLGLSSRDQIKLACYTFSSCCYLYYDDHSCDKIKLAVLLQSP